MRQNKAAVAAIATVLCALNTSLRAEEAGTAPVALPDAASASGGARLEQVRQAEAALACEEEALRHVTQLYKQGGTPVADVHGAEIKVAQARVNLAMVQGRPQEALGNLEKVVALREAAWQRAKALYNLGATPASGVSQARVELAQARIRLESQTIVAAREEQLANLSQAQEQGLAPRSEVDNARHILDEARSRAEREALQEGYAR